MKDIMAKAVEDYYKWRKACGYKDPVAIDELADAYYKGLVDMKKLMMKDAVYGEVGYWNIRGLSINMKLPKCIEDGDKVKVIIVKEE